MLWHSLSNHLQQNKTKGGQRMGGFCFGLRPIQLDFLFMLCVRARSCDDTIDSVCPSPKLGLNSAFSTTMLNNIETQVQLMYHEWNFKYLSRGSNYYGSIHATYTIDFISCCAHVRLCFPCITSKRVCWGKLLSYRQNRLKTYSCGTVWKSHMCSYILITWIIWIECLLGELRLGRLEGALGGDWGKAAVPRIVARFKKLYKNPLGKPS